MRNYNETGTVHFDQSTAENFCERKFNIARGFTLELKIPLRIWETLKSEDLDSMVVAVKGQFGMWRFDCLDPAVAETLRNKAVVVACEHLYNAFTLHQASLGNNVWATPSTMQEIGRPPEEDFIQ